MGNWEWDWWKVRQLCGELGMGLVEGEAAAWGTGNGIVEGEAGRFRFRRQFSTFSLID